MSGREMPDFNELEPDDPPDWSDPEPPDEFPADQPDENRIVPSLPVDEPESAALSIGPAGYGRNGHGRPGPVIDDVARRYPPTIPIAARTTRTIASADDDDLPAALAAAATMAADSAEAGLLAAAIVPLSLNATTPADLRLALRPALPALVKGVARLAILLIDEDARALLRLLPEILAETFRVLGQAAKEGRAITRALAGDLLAEQTETIIQRRGHPRPNRRVTGRRRHDEEWDDSDDDDCC